jgi:hypothetical protein
VLIENKQKNHTNTNLGVALRLDLVHGEPLGLGFERAKLHNRVSHSATRHAACPNLFQQVFDLLEREWPKELRDVQHDTVCLLQLGSGLLCRDNLLAGVYAGFCFLLCSRGEWLRVSRCVLTNVVSHRSGSEKSMKTPIVK